jgi:uncharacterized protein
MNKANISSALIDKFLTEKKLAIAGVSRNNKKFGYKVFDHFIKKGYTVYPIHPEAIEIDGIKCYKSAFDVPREIRNLFVVTPKHATDRLIKEALSRGYDMVWFQQKSETPLSIELANNNGLEVISQNCIFMFLDPTGGHAFHRFFMKLFGKI